MIDLCIHSRLFSEKTVLNRTKEKSFIFQALAEDCRI